MANDKLHECVREAALEEIEALVEMLRRYHATTTWAGTGFDRESVEYLCEEMIGSDDCLFLVNDGLTGFGMFHIASLPFAHKVRMVGEIAFYGGGSALELLRKGEEWAREKGAYMMVMNEHPGTRSPAKIYERKGFKMFEKSYRKVL